MVKAGVTLRTGRLPAWSPRRRPVSLTDEGTLSGFKTISTTANEPLSGSERSQKLSESLVDWKPVRYPSFGAESIKNK